MSEPSTFPESSTCPTCGTALSEAAGGMCPRCLMAGAAEPTNVPGTGLSHEPLSQADVAAAFPQFEKQSDYRTNRRQRSSSISDCLMV